MEVVVSQLKRVAAQALIGLISVTQVIILIPAHAAAADTDHVVISQVKTGSAGDTADEFIELYNPTDTAVFLGDSSVQYRGGAAGSFDKVNLNNESIAPHGYYLLGNLSGSHAASDDQSYGNASMSLSATGGTIFLVANQTTLASGTDAAIVDKVAYGSGTLFAEGTATAAPTAGNSIVRLPNNSNGNGTDTNNNANDFVSLSPASPRSSSSDTQPFGAPVVMLSSSPTKVMATWDAVASADAYAINIAQAASCAVATFADADTSLTATNAATYTHDFAALPETTYAVRVKALRGSEVTSDCETVTTGALGSVDADNLSAEIVYRKNSVAATKFGLGHIDVEVTIDGFVTTSQKPLQATYHRPSSSAVTQYLVWDSAEDVWRGTFDVTQGSLAQDGVVMVTITTAESENVPITLGSTFVIDTHVTNPIVTAASVCGPNEDKVHITTDSDVDYAYVYNTSTVNLSQLGQNLVVAVPMTQGKAEAMIGNNLYSTLYVLAIDSVGNASQLTPVTNDLQAPAVPHMTLGVADSAITAQWTPPTGATSFILRWKKTSDTTWNEVPVAGASYRIPAENNVTYDIALASVDAACNVSAFTKGQATPYMLASVAAVSMADYESDLFARSLTVGQTKDGTPTKSPYSLEEDKDQNGILDRDEDKNGNGIKDGDEPTPAPSPDSDAQTRDNSRLIAIIAVILIIAGAALAAYSWYRGDDTPPSSGGTGGAGPASESAAAPKEQTPAETAKRPEEGSKRTKGGKGGKRKTRW